MKRNNSYTLTEIAGIPYLLPYGQMIADHKPGIQLNETGTFLWNCLQNNCTMDELVNLCASYYNIDNSSDYNILKQDIESFIGCLYQKGIIYDTCDAGAKSAFFSACIRIADMVICYNGPNDLFHPAFLPFCDEKPQKIDMTINVLPRPATISQNGSVILRNEELIVMEQNEENRYILLFPTSKQLKEVHLSKDGTIAHFHCVSPFDDTLREDLFHAIRLVWLYLAQKNNRIAIHSASILYNQKAWLFSARSGVGKSTHTNLWHKLFNTPIINGDLNLITFINNEPVICGTPWCGTSGISDTATYPLGGIVLLKQSPTDTVVTLSDAQRQLHTMQRFISPTWDSSKLQSNLDFAERLAQSVPICELRCTPNDSAAILMKEYIDKGV